jgi:predicted MFS family arabinose efflux permease
MLVADLARALLIAFFALVAVNTTPLWLMFTLLFFAELFTPAFDASRTATIPDVLTDPAECAAGFGLSRTISLVTQVLGLIIGGTVIGLLGARAALYFDAATFVVSFIVILVMVKRRPAAIAGGASLLSLIGDAREGYQQIKSDTRRRSLLFLALAASLAVVAPEALALPYARGLGASDAMGAVLLATVLAGAAVGSVVVARQRPLRQIARVQILALASAAVLLFMAPAPPLFFTVLIFAMSGLLQAFLVPCMAFMTLLTPSDQRGRISGLSSAAWALATVVAFLFSGLVADLTSPAFSVVLCASISLVLILLVTHRWPARSLRESVAQLSRVKLPESGALESSYDQALAEVDQSRAMQR